MTVNNLPPLTIVPAGAGSGKTYYIQKKLAEWIRNGLAPEKIVAVTFTESAAAELRGRKHLSAAAADTALYTIYG